MKRTWNKDAEQEEQVSLFYNDSFEHQDPWDYYAVVTNFQLDTAIDRRDITTTSSEDEKQKFWSIQEVFEHHQKRGNSENFIKEEKYSYDLKHFPCLKLNANYAYGLLAMVAHNILRWVSVMTKPDKPHYSKKTKTKIYINSRQTCSSRTPSVFKNDGHQPTGGAVFTRDIGVNVGKNSLTVLHSMTK